MPKRTFNTDPYFDDFDETKNFHQILYKPKFPVQTREMNQQQSIIKNQIERFGNHIFKHGSIVTDSIPAYDNAMNYVRLKDLDTNNDDVKPELILGKKVVGKTTGISANCQLVTEITEDDPATIYVNYLTSSEDGLNKVFLDGEEIIIYDDQNNPVYSCYVRCPDCIGSTEPATETTPPTGKCAIFTVTEGIYYIWGSFVYTPTQTIILEKYDTDPNAEVGFNIIQSIITEHDDLSLLDNSLGYPNYTSPGADRYKIQLSLESTILGAPPQDNWVKLATVEWGVLKEIKDKPQYADIIDMMARRTYDESGDYTVNPFLINFKNFLKSSETSTDGIYYADESTPPEDVIKYENQFVAVVGNGKAYVKGYEVERLSDSNVIMDRARDTGAIKDTAIRYTQGNYIYVAINPQSNTYPLQNTQENTKHAVDFININFYADTNPWENGTPSSSPIGTAKVKSQLNTGKVFPSFNGATDVPVMKLYLFDIKMTDNHIFTEVESIYKGGTTTFATKVLTDDEYTEIDAGLGNGSGLEEVKIYEPTENMLITKLAEEWTNSVSDVTMTTRKKYLGSSDANGEFEINLNTGEYFDSFSQDKWIFSEKDATGNFIFVEITENKVSINGLVATITGFGTNKQIAGIINVTTSNIPSKIKTLVTTSINIELEASSYLDWHYLGKVDGRRLMSVTDITDDDSENWYDVTSDFKFDDGLTDNAYSLCKIKRTLTSQPDYNASNKAKYEIVFEYFNHPNSNNGYMYTATSYQSMIDDPAQDFDYEDIPTYTSQNGDIYQLRRCMDFRVDEKVDGSGDYVETGFIPSHDSNIIHDVTFYLPRIDKIVIDSKTSTFLVVKGIPSIVPTEPKTPKNTMALYTINLKPYTLSVQDDVYKKYVNNRRFTMRDIGKIEKRVDNLEYYTTFTMLEKDAESTSIKDANGVSRFKNGLITDNFADLVASDTAHPEFNGAIDVKKREMRPTFYTRKVHLSLDTDKSENFRITGNVITQNYNEFVFNTQALSSKTLSVNPYFIFNWEGTVELIPSYDSDKQVDRKPALIVNIDAGMDNGKNLPDGKINEVLFGNWEANQLKDIDNKEKDNLLEEGLDFVGEDKFLSAEGIGNKRIVDGKFVQDVKITKDVTVHKSLGDKITDVQILPFAREQDIQFVATAMRPNTVIYAFFDDINVSQYCRPLNGANGDQMKTTSTGEFLGVFSLPNNDDVNFHTGDRKFKLTDSDVDSNDSDIVTTTAITKFWSGNLKTTVQETKLEQTHEETKTVTVTGGDANVCMWRGVAYKNGTKLIGHGAVTPWYPGKKPNHGSQCINGNWANYDPIAQSFSVELQEAGVFLTKIDVFFSAKSADATVWLELREMDNGYPSPKVLPFSHVVKQPRSIEITDDASKATTFVFDSPVFLEGKTDYCFVIGSTDLAYRVHVARLGEIDKSGGMISTQPSLGSLFKSQNNKTWNAEQMEDIKFNLYQANFDRDTPMKLRYIDNGYEVDNLPYNPIETENESDIVRIKHRNHGFIPGDKLSLDLLTKTEFQVVIKSGDLIIGQQLHVGNGSTCVVTNSTFLEDMSTPSGHAGKRFNVRVKDIVGFIDAGEGNPFTADQYIEEIKLPYILDKLDIDQEQIGNWQNGLSSCVGYFEESLNTDINGIPLDALTDPVQPLQVLTVDSFDSYSIEVAGFPANLTGVTGGDGGQVKGHVQVDMFNLGIDMKKYDCNVHGELTGTTHSPTNGIFENYTPAPMIEFNDNANQILLQPLKVANEHNNGVTGDKSMDIDIIATTIIKDSNVSPVVMIPSISFTSITNRVDWNDQAHYEVAPNHDYLWDTENPQPDKARWVDETDPVEGVESAKYVLQKVTLANPATMLKIYADIFKPKNSTVDFYYKTLPVESSGGLEDQPWIYAPFDEDFVSSTAGEFIESTITIGDEDLGVMPIPDYREFRIKMVLRSKNSAIVPRVKRFRAIAVT